MNNNHVIEFKYYDIIHITELCIESYMNNAHKEKGAGYAIEQARAQAVLGHWLNIMLAYKAPASIVMNDMEKLRKIIFN